MNNIKVHFYDSIDDIKVKYAVIAARYQNKWVFCKHRDRNTYEIPGGHREPNERIDDTAKRELYEETGAIKFTIRRISAYSVESINDGKKDFGILYFADILAFDNELHYEIERIDLFDDIPSSLTYPLIQPYLFARVKDFINFTE